MHCMKKNDIPSDVKKFIDNWNDKEEKRLICKNPKSEPVVKYTNEEEEEEYF